MKPSFCTSWNIEFSVISKSERQMGVNSCFSRACCVSPIQVILLLRLRNTHISHAKLFAVMSFESCVILHSAGDDPGSFYLSAQTVYPLWQRQTVKLSFIGYNLRCGFLPAWKGLSGPCFAKSPVRSKMLPNGTIIARVQYFRLVALILLQPQRCQTWFTGLWTKSGY